MLNASNKKLIPTTQNSNLYCTKQAKDKKSISVHEEMKENYIFYKLLK